MWIVRVTTFYRAVPGGYDPDIKHLYSGQWSDVTGLADENITPAPNLIVMEGVVSDATKLDMDFDAALPDAPFAILSSELIEEER